MAKQQRPEPAQKGQISSTTGTSGLHQIEDVRKLSTENPPERLDYTEGEGLKVKPFITRIPGHYSHTIRSVDKWTPLSLIDLVFPLTGCATWRQRNTFFLPAESCEEGNLFSQGQLTGAYLAGRISAGWGRGWKWMNESMLCHFATP